MERTRNQENRRRRETVLVSGREAENSVGIVTAEHLINKVTLVRRTCDRIKIVRTVIGKTIFIPVSVNAPQTGRHDQKQDFHHVLDKMLQECEAVIVAGDLNGLVALSKRDESVHGGLGVGEKNAEGTGKLDFALAYKLRSPKHG